MGYFHVSEHLLLSSANMTRFLHVTFLAPVQQLLCNMNSTNPSHGYPSLSNTSCHVE